MFQLPAEKWEALTSQPMSSIAGNLPGRRGRRTSRCAFTEQGVATLSSVLDIPRAIAVNIEIMRTFVRARVFDATHGDLPKPLVEIAGKSEPLAVNHDTFSRDTRNCPAQVLDAPCELTAPLGPPQATYRVHEPRKQGQWDLGFSQGLKLKT